MESKGFTLLESIVALVILSMVGLSVLTWVGQSSQAVNQLLEREQEHNLKKSVIALASIINPKQRPNGSLQIEQYTISWQSQQQTNANSLLVPNGALDQDLSVYTLFFTVVDGQQNTLLERFAVAGTGYGRVIQPQ